MFSLMKTLKMKKKKNSVAFLSKRKNPHVKDMLQLENAWMKTSRPPKNNFKNLKMSILLVNLNKIKKLLVKMMTDTTEEEEDTIEDADVTISQEKVMKQKTSMTKTLM